MAWDFELKSFQKHLSAIWFSALETQEVLDFIAFSNIQRCKPWAQRSKGKRGHLALSNHDRAETLSTPIDVIVFVQNEVKVSHVISKAMNSATFIKTLAGSKSVMDTTLAQSSYEICQNRPDKPSKPLRTPWKCMAPAMPKALEASQDSLSLLAGNRFKR